MKLLLRRDQEPSGLMRNAVDKLGIDVVIQETEKIVRTEDRRKLAR